MNSAMVFCTSYFQDKAVWEKRYRRWLDYNAKLFQNSKLFLIDDGSPYRPVDGDVRINEALGDSFELGDRGTIFRFKDRLGRPSMHDYPGWFRSFSFSGVIAEKLNFKKIIHIESDTYILSRAALNAIERMNSGWTAFWCPRFGMPETCLQVICEDSFGALETIRNTPYEHFKGTCIEARLPFTFVEKSIYGNRYGEYRSRVPSYADFAAQVDERTRFTSQFGS